MRIWQLDYREGSLAENEVQLDADGREMAGGTGRAGILKDTCSKNPKVDVGFIYRKVLLRILLVSTKVLLLKDAKIMTPSAEWRIRTSRRKISNGPFFVDVARCSTSPRPKSSKTVQTITENDINDRHFCIILKLAAFPCKANHSTAVFGMHFTVSLNIYYYFFI